MAKKNNLYTLHGLSVASEIEISELRPAAGGKPDVHIGFGTLGHIPLSPENPRGKHRLGPNRLLLNVDGVGRFLMESGQRIIIDPHTGVTRRTLHMFLLGSCFGVILHQRSILPVHGNGIFHAGQCTILCGHSGRGKSTLAAALVKRGYRILSDDVCAVYPTKNEAPLVYPGLAHLKLWRDASEYLQVPWRQHRRVAPDLDKYMVPLPESGFDEPVRLKQVVVLQFHRRNSFFIEDLAGMDRVQALQTQTYRYGMLKALGRIERHFQICGAVARQVPVIRACRPKNLARLEEFVDLIEANIQGSP